MTQQVIDFLNGQENFEAATEVTSYQVEVRGRTLAVELHDAGEAGGAHRYSVAAYWAGTPEEDRHGASGVYTLGNPEASIEMALHGPHWWMFTPDN